MNLLIRYRFLVRTHFHLIIFLAAGTTTTTTLFWKSNIVVERILCGYVHCTNNRKVSSTFPLLKDWLINFKSAVKYCCQLFWMFLRSLQKKYETEELDFVSPILNLKSDLCIYLFFLFESLSWAMYAKDKTLHLKLRNFSEPYYLQIRYIFT